ncbi:MAG: HAD-IIIA family hydrolase [Puniceicoccales bacterium]|jgi:D-glycero-D-manno-heptose 1,7-bisphosphate phosphatase|nr:HAD-IIIA family hydrolase [Puniceicoccales bacterium]
MGALGGIFFDRDGTLCENGSGYLGDPEKIILVESAAQVLAAMGRAGYLLFLITNQSGVGRGYFPAGAAHRCNQRLKELLGHGKIFRETCVSTGTPDRPDLYRKPSAKFLLEMCAKYALEPAYCWVIGDSPCDGEMAAQAGARAILIGAGSGAAVEQQGVFRWRVPNLPAAWDLIRRQDGAPAFSAP